MKKIKKISTISLILTILVALLMETTLLIQAQTTSTPEEWVTRISQTPEGAWRPITGVTDYPAVQAPRQDPACTGYSEGPGPKTDHVLWRSDTPFELWPRIVIDNGAVYTVSRDQNALFAFDAHTGEVLWNYAADGLQSWQMAVLANLIWIRVGRDVIGVAKSTGEVRRVISGVTAMDVTSPFGDPFGGAYTLFLWNSTGRETIAYTVDCWGSNWRIREEWRSGNITQRLKSYCDGKLYGETSEGHGIACVNATTGDLMWEFTTPEGARFYYSSVADGRVYAYVYARFIDEPENIMYTLDATSGKLLWDYHTEGAFVELAAVAYDRVYLVGGEENKLYCLRAEDGGLLWTFEADGTIDFYGPVVADGAVYFNAATQTFTGYPPTGSFEGYTYAVDSITGDLIWKYLTPTMGSMVAIADGILYATTSLDYIYAWGKGPTTTDLSVTSSQPTIDQGVTVYGSVTDMSPFSQQHPDLQSPLVAGVPVVLNYVKDGTWTDFATVDTDSAGTFTYTWIPPSEGTYTVYSRFEGDDAYYWSSDKTTVQVNPAPTSGETDLTPLEDSVSMVEDSISNQTTYILVILALVIIAIVIAVYSMLKSRK